MTGSHRDDEAGRGGTRRPATSGGAAEGAAPQRDEPRRNEPRRSASRRGEPRRLGDILGSTLTDLAHGDQAKAYGAWARAAGDQIAGATRPRAFQRGQLTVECDSSVWAQELTLLGGSILRRMDELAAGHPVQRLRFVVAARAPQAQAHAEADALEPVARQLSDADLAGARAQARGVSDERLRAAIEALLGIGAPPSGDAGEERQVDT